jgi:hypothetical protein
VVADRNVCSGGGKRAMEQLPEHQARHKALIHEVNERIHAIGSEERVWDASGIIEFLCECGHDGCQASVRLTLPEYWEVRAQSRFLVSPGHETAGCENTLEHTDRYFIVEKVAAAAFVEDDHRGGNAQMTVPFVEEDAHVPLHPDSASRRPCPYCGN